MTRWIRNSLVPAILLPFAVVAMAQVPLLTAPANYPTAGALRPAVADFDGDGRPDIAVPGSNGTTSGVYVLLAHPTLRGTFRPATFLPLGFSPSILAAADFDRDGRMDLVSEGTGGIVFFKGNGNGTFQNGLAIAAGGSGIASLQVADLNGDGIPDLVTTFAIRVFLGRGDGTVGSPTLYLSGCTGSADALFTLGDFNGDNRLDAVSPCASGSAGLAFVPGNANGTFGAAAFFGSNPGYVTVVSGDFDGDGRRDVIAATDSGIADFYKGNGDGTFQAARSIPGFAGTVPLGIAAADVNADGRLDLITAFDQLRVFPGLGNGTFGTAAVFPLQVPVVDHFVIPAVDLNGDGESDLVVQGTDHVSVYLSTPPSVFLTAAQNPVIAGQPAVLTAVVASPVTGVLYQAGGTIQFSQGPGRATPVALANGQAIYNPSTITEGIHVVNATYLNANGVPVAVAAPFSLTVNQHACAANVTPQVSISQGGFRLDRITNQFVQTVTLTNISATPISGPLSIALAGLTSGVTLLNANGATRCGGQRSVPYADTGVCLGRALLPGQSVQFDLRFSNPSRGSIQYNPGVIAGTAPR